MSSTRLWTLLTPSRRRVRLLATALASAGGHCGSTRRSLGRARMGAPQGRARGSARATPPPVGGAGLAARGGAPAPRRAATAAPLAFTAAATAAAPAGRLAAAPAVAHLARAACRPARRGLPAAAGATLGATALEVRARLCRRAAPLAAPAHRRAATAAAAPPGRDLRPSHRCPLHRGGESCSCSPAPSPSSHWRSPRTSCGSRRWRRRGALGGGAQGRGRPSAGGSPRRARLRIAALIARLGRRGALRWCRP